VSVSIKTTLALILNTAITPLILYANFDMQTTSIMLLGIGAGDHHDFTSKWYATIGSDICTTMLLSIVTSNIYPIYEFLKSVLSRSWSSHYAVTQDELDRSYRGWDWKLEYRVPVILNFFFVCLMFSTGMPILYVIGAFAFAATYMFEKFTFLNVANRPPQYKERIAILIASVMPLGALLKIAIGGWMLTNHSLTLLNINNFSLYTRMFTTFAGIVALLFLVGTVIFRLLQLLLVDFLYKPLSFVLTFCCSFGGAIARGHSSLHRKFLPGYTEIFALHPSVDYLHPVEEDEWDKLTQAQIDDGWMVEEDPRGGVIRCKKWMETIVVHNIKRANGMKKRTWEVMEDAGLHTYNPIANTVYEEAIKQMNDLKGKGAENIMA
jgi:hypothetical protein